jgi:drug/metabolite transporter (DMT)-like permease
MKPLQGALLVIGSSVAFGAMAIFARYAYAAGVDPVSLLFIRFSLAGVVLLVIMLYRKGALPTGKTLLGYSFMGGVGYVGQSLSYFIALTMASASSVALLLYTFPAIIAVLESLWLRQKFSFPKLLALVLSLSGVALTIGFDVQGKLLGITLAIAAAVIYSFYILTGKQLAGRTSVLASSTTIMLSAGVVFGGLTFLRGFQAPTSVEGWLAVAGIVGISTIFAMLSFFAGLEHVGATNAAMLSTFEPVTTVLLAALFLGEPLSIFTFLGGGMILASALLLTHHEWTKKHQLRGMSSKSLIRTKVK